MKGKIAASTTAAGYVQGRQGRRPIRVDTLLAKAEKGKKLKKTEDLLKGAADDKQSGRVSPSSAGSAGHLGRTAPLSGIPDFSRRDVVPNVHRRNDNIRMGLSISHHPAERRGDHLDMRLVEPASDGGRAHSWALPKELPEPGKSVPAIQQPTHTEEYAMREKPFAIREGYGKTRPGEKVSPVSVGQAEVVESSEDKIRFLRHRSSGSDEFVLRRTGDKVWRLHNATKNRNTIEGQKIPDYKRKYKQIDPEKLNVHNPEEILSAKIDGASILYQPGGPGRFNRIYSYRRPVGGSTGLIEHTFKDPDFNKRSSSKEMAGSIFRGEMWFEDVKTGKPLPASQIAGLLNSGVDKSRSKQKELGVRPRISLFDVVKHRGKNVEENKFADKLPILEQAAKEVDGVDLPPMAMTPESKSKLIKDVKEGRCKETSEGLVVRHLFKERDIPTKSVFRPTHDVYFREIIEEKGQRGRMAGAIRYSYTPDGPIVGRVGTGFNHALKREMAEEPEKFIGRVGVVRSMSEPGTEKALRAPSFQHWHPDKNDPEMFKEAGGPETPPPQLPPQSPQYGVLAQFVPPEKQELYRREAEGALDEAKERAKEVAWALATPKGHIVRFTEQAAQQVADKAKQMMNTGYWDGGTPSGGSDAG